MSLQKIISTQQYVCNPFYQQNSKGVRAIPHTDSLCVITHAPTLAQHKRTRGNAARVFSSYEGKSKANIVTRCWSTCICIRHRRIVTCRVATKTVSKNTLKNVNIVLQCLANIWELGRLRAGKKSTQQCCFALTGVLGVVPEVSPECSHSALTSVTFQR
jgi:hypothetical protein